MFLCGCHGKESFESSNNAAVAVEDRMYPSISKALKSVLQVLLIKL